MSIYNLYNLTIHVLNSHILSFSMFIKIQGVLLVAIEVMKVVAMVAAMMIALLIVVMNNFLPIVR